MLTIQQLIKALRKLQNGNTTAKTAVDLAKYLKNATTTTAPTTAQQAIVTSLLAEQESNRNFGATLQTPNQQATTEQQASNETTSTTKATHSSQNISQRSLETLSQILQSKDDGNGQSQSSVNATITFEHLNYSNVPSKSTQQQQSTQDFSLHHRSQQIQNFYQQQLLHFHTQPNSNLKAKQQQTQFAMSSLAAAVEPLALKQQQQDEANNAKAATNSNASGASNSGDNRSSSSNGISCQDDKKAKDGAAPCFNTGFAEILKFMELIGNLKHTKRTGWVLRDVSDCESISGHMYRMSMMTFLLDGSEGLNQIRCMELALVHDLAESLVGDITPFCGVSKADKRAMEFKAMDDICKLIEPRGKRIMELFEEYEQGESAESKFVKDLDRLDMVMQAFEYEKRDNCLLKHQEFFDSTEGKFNHPFVKKVVDEICAQRNALARAKGATPPPSIHVPDMEAEDFPSSARNGHSEDKLGKQQTNSSSS